MAGDIHLLLLMDNENIIKKLYIGKMRYWESMFSMIKYKYYCGCNNDKYSYLIRLSNGKEMYSVLDFKTINLMRTILQENKPITTEEQNAYDDTESIISFIDENVELITQNNYDIVLHTCHDM